MDLIYKIVAIGIITSIATLIIKPIRGDFAIMIAITGGIIILLMLINYLSGIFNTFQGIINSTGISTSVYTLILKIIGIGYLIEFSAGICNDSGNSSLGDKILLGGKVVIMVMALPIITNILQIISELLPKWKVKICFGNKS